MKTNRERLRANARAASTEDLLDRVTVYRQGLEPEALAEIESELRDRGVSAEAIARHAEEREALPLVRGADGLPLPCWRCRRPAVAQGWGWHRLWGVVPVFPRRVAFCAEHRP